MYEEETKPSKGAPAVFPHLTRSVLIFQASFYRATSKRVTRKGCADLGLGLFFSASILRLTMKNLLMTKHSGNSLPEMRAGP